MMYSTILLTALMALSSGVEGLALPSLFTREKCIEELPQYQQTKANQSTVFGYQLAGSAKDQDELDETCAKLNNGGYDKWAQEGLIIYDIKKPICNARDSSPNATTTLPKLVATNTKLLTTLLLNSFPSTNKSAYAYLCSNLRYVQLDGFLLNSNAIIADVCSTGSAPQGPQPFSAVAGVNESAVQDFRTASANLFAYTSASASTSQEDLNLACAHAPTHKPAWSTLLLNATAVEQTLCSIKSPLSVAEAKGKITEWTSRLFATVVGNISNAPGYREFLCEGLCEESMREVGLEGGLVKDLVCRREEGDEGVGS